MTGPLSTLYERSHRAPSLDLIPDALHIPVLVVLGIVIVAIAWGVATMGTR